MSGFSGLCYSMGNKKSVSSVFPCLACQVCVTVWENKRSVSSALSCLAWRVCVTVWENKNLVSAIISCLGAGGLFYSVGATRRQPIQILRTGGGVLIVVHAIVVRSLTSRPYKAGTGHAGFSPDQALISPSAKRREVFGESHEG